MKFRILMALLLTAPLMQFWLRRAIRRVAQNAPTVGRAATTVDETARFLAGMPVTGALEPLTHDPGMAGARSGNERGLDRENNSNKSGQFGSGCRLMRRISSQQ